MLLTAFKLYKNVPNIQLNKTILFDTSSERDNYFSNFETIEFNSNFNYRIDKGSVYLPNDFVNSNVSHSKTQIGNLNGYDYGSFFDKWENRRYYFFVNSYQYINDNVIEMSIIIDVLTTFIRSSDLNSFKNLSIERQHLTNSDYQKYLPLLRTNNDVLNTFTSKVLVKKNIFFNEFYIMITVSANLTKDFGSEDSPKVPFSNGGRYDMLTSPLDLYVCEYSYFNTFINYLEDYPWIAQNIQKCVMIPKSVVDSNDLVSVQFKDNSTITFYKFKNDGLSKNKVLDFNYTFNDLLSDLNISVDELHLLRSNYVGVKLTDYTGNEVIFDAGRVNTLNFYQMSSVGYDNIIRVLLSGYNSNQKDPNLYRDGDYLDTCLTIDDFDELPVFINNGKLSKANNAYNRAYENSNTTQSRINRITDNSNSLQDRLVSGLQLFSSVSSFSDVANLYANDYDYYRKQQAEFKTYDLQKPTVTNAKYTKSNLIKEGTYGYWLIISDIDNVEMANVKNYYRLNGFELNVVADRLSNVKSMSIVNYVKFSGDYKLYNININFIPTIKNLFDQGVYCYHYDSSKGLNPFTYDLTQNERIL